MMAKKYFQKALSVGLSLALCAGLVAPSLAATFEELQQAINNDQGDAANHAVYGANKDIHAWTGEDGTRNVQLHGDVDSDPVNTSDPNTIYVSNGKVSIDLNGNNINGNQQGGAVIEVSGGATLTLDDHSNDSNPNADVGKITGGTDSGIFVQGGTLVMNDGEITNNTAGGSKTQGHGGGVHVNNDKSSFTMNGGTITGNTANVQGGGVFVQNGTFTMNGGEISNNTAKWGGGVNTIGGTVNMTDGTIGNNIAKVDGSDVWVKNNGGKNASFTMSGDSAINGSAAKDGQHTVAVEGNSTFTMNENATVESSDSAAADILAKNGSTVNYSRGDNGGLRDAAATDDNAELLTTVNPSKDTGLNIEYPPAPESPVVDPADPVEVTIDEPAVPLAAGPVTRAEFIDYLWRHEGEPASDGVCTFTDVPEDHEYVLALAWAEQNKVAFAYDDGTFEPDELITVGAAREFLDNFAKIFGTNAVAAADLKSLTGADDEAVLNCGEVLAEFFGA